MSQGVRRRKKENWILLLVVVVMGVFILIYFINQSNQSVVQSSSSLINSIQNNSEQAERNINSQTEAVVYENSEYGFSFEVSDDWQVNTVTTGEGEDKIFTIDIFLDDKSVGVSVMSASQENLLWDSISINKEIQVEVSGQEAVQLFGSSAKDGSETSIVILKHDGRLYSFRGTGTEFDETVASFSLK